MGRFVKGNPGGPGGARPGAGRKPLDKKAIAEAAERIELLVDAGDGQGPRRMQLGLACFHIMGQIAAGEFKGADVKNEFGETIGSDDGANKARVQLAACDKILNRLLGRPALQVDVNLGGGVQLLAKLDEIPRKVIDTTAREISATPSRSLRLDGKPPAKTRPRKDRGNRSPA